jgi:hypothetical protein
MATIFANGVVGEGQSAQVTSLSFTYPASLQAGDRLIVYVNSSDSGLTFDTLPSGTTVKDGPRANGSSQGTAVLEKILAGTESGTFSVPWTSGAARATLQWAIWRGTTGTSTVAFVQESSAVSSFPIPSHSGVAAGSAHSAATLRRRSGASSANIDVDTPWTEGTDVKTVYGTGINVFGQTAYILSSAGGTVGGQNFTPGGFTSLGTTYHIVMPTAAPALDDLRAGTATVGLRVGTDTPSKVYAGTTQVWP